MNKNQNIQGKWVPLQKIFFKDIINKKEIKSSNMLSSSFKWKHFVGEIILLNVRWYFY